MGYQLAQAMADYAYIDDFAIIPIVTRVTFHNVGKRILHHRFAKLSSLPLAGVSSLTSSYGCRIVKAADQKEVFSLLQSISVLGHQLVHMVRSKKALECDLPVKCVDHYHPTRWRHARRVIVRMVPHTYFICSVSVG